MGPELMDNMRKQAERFGAEFLTDDVTRVELVDTGDPGSDAMKTVWVGETAYRAKAVILATGSAWRPLGVPGEQEFLGHGVSSCATCDGFFFRGQRHRGRRRRRLGDGGGHLPHPVRRERDDHPPPRRVPGQQDHGGAGAGQPEDQGRVEHRGRGDPRRRRQGHRRTGPQRAHRRGPRSSTSPACSWRSATTRAASCSAARSTWTTSGYVQVEPPEHPHQPPRRVRRRRPRRPHLPAGDHRRRHRLRRRRWTPSGSSPR